jgi:glycine/D-amino acid oxidase-like deaminating enzyme
MQALSSDSDLLPASLYQSVSTPGMSFAPLDGDTRCSVAIVGAGYTGLSTALHLAEAGVDTLVLEAREPGWGASGRNGGQVNPGLKLSPDDLERRYGADLGRRMASFSGDAPGALFDLAERLGIDCDQRRTGTLRADCSESAQATTDALHRQYGRLGANVERLNADTMAAATGTQRYIGGLLDHRGGHINPLALARGLAAAANRAGARIHAHSGVRTVVKGGDHWLLDTRHGVVRAEKILIATNGYSDDLWPRLKQSVVPVFSTIGATAPLPDALASTILPGRHAVYETGRITVYYRLDSQNRLLMGGRGPQRSLSGATPPLYLQRYAERLWPALTGRRWSHAWNGQLAMTEDHIPHIHEPDETVLLYLGCNGRGVALATAIGPQLADRLRLGKASPLDLPVLPVTPIRFHAFWPIGVTAALLWGRLRDYLDR